MNTSLSVMADSNGSASHIIAQIERIFSVIDQDSDGKLNQWEIKKSANAAGVPLDSRSAKLLTHMYDKDGDGFVEKAEFMAAMLNREASISKAFYEMQSNSGHSEPVVLAEDLRPLLATVSLKVSNTELHDFLVSADSDHDGVISLDEFRYFACFLPSTNPRACFDEHSSFHVEAADGHTTVVSHGNPSMSWWNIGKKLVAAGVAGTCSRTATAPIDRLKVMMQAGEISHGLLGGLRSIYKEEGLLAFFRGNGANCVKIAPETAAKFLAFDIFSKAIASKPDCPSAVERFMAGGAAGATAQAAIYPLEIAKTQLALAPPGTYSGIAGCLKDVAVTDGVRGLYAGMGASMAGIVPYAAIDLAINSMLKDSLSKMYEARGSEPGVVTLLGCGMVSSSVAMISTYPLNLVRTRLQAMGVPGAPRYKGPGDVVRKVVTADGYRGLYRGIVPNMLKVLPATSISYALYDCVNKLMK